MVTSLGIGKNGRAGNQLFQIAATLGLAAKHNDVAVFPKWHCSYTNKDMSVYFKNPINQSYNGEPVIDYKEPHFHYSEIPYQPNLNLQGYFQSPRYFEGHEDLIRYHFQPSEAIISKWFQLKDSRWNHLYGNICSIHVRRGDYISVSSAVHNICDFDYYRRAIEYVKSKAKIDTWVVFSDDIEWCKKRFISPSNSYMFIENGLSGDKIHRENKTDVEELFLMSFCSHNIISNSSFSWWSAYLNDNPNKIVVAPKRWFNNGFNTKDLISVNSIRI